MSTTLNAPMDSAPAGQGTARRKQGVTRVWLAVLMVAIVGLLAWALLLFGWMVDETHFDRPTPEFDQLASRLEDVPGVDVVDKERWVEAPMFSAPTSWVSVRVDEAGLPALLAAACSIEYPETVMWSINVTTPSAAEISLHATSDQSDTVGGEARCLDLGFDAVRLVEELDRVAPGLALQPTIWEDDRFAFVVRDEGMPDGFIDVLPLVEHSDELLAAAGLDADDVVEISSGSLMVVLEPGESAAYLEMLTDLAEIRGVRSYWADSIGAQSDGIDKVQVVGPEEQHTAIEEIIRSSALHIADRPVRFIAP